MRQRWWIAIVAVVGIGLAVLLFPRPDTGQDIPDADPTNTDPLNFDGQPSGKPGRVARAPGEAGEAGEPGTAMPPKPGTEPRSATRSRPEVVYASKLVTPFSAIRYTLMKTKDNPDAVALADEIKTLSNAELRQIRLDPDAVTWDQLQSKTDPMIAKVAASSFATDPTIAKALERYKQFVAEYHEVKANGGTLPAAAEGEGTTPNPASDAKTQAVPTPAVPATSEKTP
ncbi:MAG: hypothetical protein ABMB14_16145 [Myxococcota bacterium]